MRRISLLLMSTEEQHSHLKATLENLCISIRGFIDQDVDRAVYKAPIIDHHHPDDYQQRAITGLKKFLGHAEAERDYVSGVSLNIAADKDLFVGSARSARMGARSL